jgi:hypothetical protein
MTWYQQPHVRKRAPLLLIIVLGGLVLVFWKQIKTKLKLSTCKSYLNQKDLVRGLRNNNPGNIRRGNTAWEGKIPHDRSEDKAFEQFECWKWGVRAMVKLLQTYIHRKNDTIRKIISTWAPPNENNTAEYIRWVSQQSGINADVRIAKTDKDKLRKITKAMAWKENGRECVSDEDFNEAWNLI